MRVKSSVVGLAAVLSMGGNLCGAETAAKPITYPNSAEVTKPCVFTNATGETLNYREYRSKGLMSLKKYPLVIFLHGAGERSTDNVSQLANGTQYIISYSERTKQPMIFIAPQCPPNQQWVNTPWEAASHTMPAEPSVSMRLTIELIQSMVKKNPMVDAKRIYVMGLSMGGYGTWDAIQRHPELFAAAMPICGGGDPQFAAKIKDVPVWAFHGDKDVCVQPQRTKTMIEAIQKAGGKPNYTAFPEQGHVCWDEAFKDDAVMKWFFSQRKK